MIVTNEPTIGTSTVVRGRPETDRDGRSMCSLLWGADARQRSGRCRCPIALPWNSRDDSQHQKTGTVACALFESSVGFPAAFLRSATNVMVIKIRKTQARCDFEDIPPGRYAIAVIHDENMNGKLDTNPFGIPTEGYGFSNDAGASRRVPSFYAASFQYDGQSVELTIGLRY